MALGGSVLHTMNLLMIALAPVFLSAVLYLALAVERRFSDAPAIEGAEPAISE